MKFIIFEGADCGGKSTAIDNLKNSYLLEYSGYKPVVYHFDELKGLNTAEVFNQYIAPIVRHYNETDTLLIYDRCHISDYPYAKAVGRPPRDNKVLGDLIVEIADLIVHCRPPTALAVDKFIKRKDTEYLDSLKQYKKVLNLYDKVMLDLASATRDKNEFLGDKVVTYVYTDIYSVYLFNVLLENLLIKGDQPC